MIQEFVKQFEANKDALRAQFKAKRPDNYGEIVRAVVESIRDPEEYGAPDPDLIHEIDDGSYSGVLIFVIGANGYCPHDYWYVKVEYGSCSACDTLQAIRGYSDDGPDDDELDGYMTLALHIVQRLKKMEDEDERAST